MDLEYLRKLFPVTDKAIFLNHAAIGPSPIPVIDECEKWMVQYKTYGDMYFPSLDQFLEQFNEYRKTTGNFINANNPEKEIAFSYNTSYGLSAIAEAIEWKTGDKIILNDLEYTSNSYTYQVLARKFGLEINVIQNKDGILPLEAFIDVLNSDTRLVAISHVQFSNGFRIDLKELAKLTHENEAHLIVDAIQSCGAIPIDVQSQDIDYLVAGGYKWLLGSMGTSFLYVKKEIADGLNPSFIGSMSDSEPLSLSHHSYSHAEGAKRFQASIGPHAVIIAKAIEFLDNIGIKNIFHHIMCLTDLIIEYIQDESSFNLQTPIENISQRSGIVNFTCPNGDKIFDQLRKLPIPIVISYREGGIRISPHCYNTEEEILTCLETIKTLSSK